MRALAAPAALLWLAATPALAGPTWADYFAKSETYIFYLEQEATRREGPLLTATVRMIPLRQEYKAEIIRQRQAAGVATEGYEGYSHTIQVWEIDQARGLHRIVKSADYDAQGRLLDAAAWPEAELEHIPPGSVVDKLLYELPSFGTLPPPKTEPVPAPAP